MSSSFGNLSKKSPIDIASSTLTHIDLHNLHTQLLGSFGHITYKVAPQSDRSGFPESLQAVPPEYPSLPYKMPAQIYPSTNAKAAAPPSYKASTAMARGSGGGISSSNPPRISGAISQFPQGLQEEFRCVMTHTHTHVPSACTHVLQKVVDLIKKTHTPHKLKKLLVEQKI